MSMLYVECVKTEVYLFPFYILAESKVAMARAFLLALFSHLVTKFLGDVHKGLYGPESLLALFDPDASTGHEVGKGKESSVDPEKNSASRKKRVGLDRFKRRHKGSKGRRGSSDDESGETLFGCVRLKRGTALKLRVHLAAFWPLLTLGCDHFSTVPRCALKNDLSSTVSAKMPLDELLINYVWRAGRAFPLPQCKVYEATFHLASCIC